MLNQSFKSCLSWQGRAGWGGAGQGVFPVFMWEAGPGCLDHLCEYRKSSFSARLKFGFVYVLERSLGVVLGSGQM